MKIVHLCLANFFIDNYSYQENILSKYHKKLGNDVTVIASLFSFDENGQSTFLKKEQEYINNDKVKVIRVDYKNKFKKINRILRIYSKTYKLLEQEKPDFIFIHGCQFLDIKQVVKYLKNHKNIKVVVDNHADFSNSAKNWLSKNILHKIIWRRCAKLIESYTTTFYGVLPARVDFLINVYKIPREKVELLVMGAEDEKVELAKDKNIRKTIREKYNIKPDDFLIMTGGKIDNNKPQTFLLMEAVKKIDRNNIKLLIFGSVKPEYKDKFSALLCDTVQYIGWVDSKETYKFFNASDLVVFPGLHSVFWEQVVGLGKPCVFRHMKGFTHIDIGGNCKFLYEDSVDQIEKVINEIVCRKEVYERMKDVAVKKGMDVFSYKKIAQKSILND